jgi:hypothetical protein
LSAKVEHTDGALERSRVAAVLTDEEQTLPVAGPYAIHGCSLEFRKTLHALPFSGGFEVRKHVHELFCLANGRTLLLHAPTHIFGRTAATLEVEERTDCDNDDADGDEDGGAHESVIGAADSVRKTSRVKRLPAELVPRLPEPARKVLRGTVRTYGRATARWRRLPDFLILGAQKAGTTALYAYLRWHPRITGPAFKEVSFFDRHYPRGETWYRAHLPARVPTETLVGEASPSYLFHPLAPERVRALVPDARLIAILRNPVDRAFSHYQHEVSLGREALSFEQAIEREDERMEGEVERMLRDPSYFSYPWWNYTYLARGRYAEQLERWFGVFPREQLLVLSTEELAGDTAATYARVLDFLGFEQHDLDEYPRIFEREYAGMSPATRARLEAYFEQPNERLEQVLKESPGNLRPAAGASPWKVLHSL